MKFKLLLFLICVLAIHTRCSKDRASQTHCDGLVDDPRSPGEFLAVQIPNAFTPNGDGLNDQFKLFFTKVRSVKFSIYDEKGNIIFTSEDPETAWNPAGTIKRNTRYYCRVEAMDLNGKRVGKCGEFTALLCYPPGFDRTKLHYVNEVDSLGGWTNHSGEQLKTCD